MSNLNAGNPSLESIRPVTGPSHYLQKEGWKRYALGEARGSKRKEGKERVIDERKGMQANGAGWVEQVEVGLTGVMFLPP